MNPVASLHRRLLNPIRIALLGIAVAALAGCYYPYPVTASPPPSKYDRVWEAAYGAAADVGVQIQTADRASGVIRGTKDGVIVNINVRAQSDGGAMAEIKATGPAPHDRVVSQQLSQAYDRRMGR
ncbi:MAG TPA: hypothetical protein VFP70_03460 [Burkholderiales bacterium]|nr:hypothetical protein [Burkholderiales bacterium]